MQKGSFSRRDFLKTAALGLGGLAFSRSDGGFFYDPAFAATNRSADNTASTTSSATALALADFPPGERLGRVLNDQVEVKARPDDASAIVGVKYTDDVVVWLREVVGSRPMWHNQRFVETPEGYIYAPNMQPVFNQPNTPLRQMPASGGFWAEVSVPYVDLTLANPPKRSPWLDHTLTPRLYNSQIMWVDEIKQDEGGRTLYRAGERYGTFGDIFWADGAAFRPISEEEISPINPQAEEKRVVVDLSYQTLSCFEGQDEVFFCRISAGVKLNSEGSASYKWATPLGNHTIWRKLVSVHMTGGTTGGGYDLPGIGWTSLFSGQGMAIHSTFWHNSFGIAKSHGCVNARPEDAKWIFRWTLPHTPAEPGDITVSGKGSSKVLVVEN